MQTERELPCVFRDENYRKAEGHHTFYMVTGDIKIFPPLI